MGPQQLAGQLLELRQYLGCPRAQHEPPGGTGRTKVADRDTTRTGLPAAFAMTGCLREKSQPVVWGGGGVVNLAGQCGKGPQRLSKAGIHWAQRLETSALGGVHRLGSHLST